MRRIRHVAASFFIVVVAYWTYAATVVPLVEPERREVNRNRASRINPADFAHRESRYASLFEGLFPPHHWTRTSPPKVIEVGQGMFVLQDYETYDDGQTHDEGRITVEPCVLIYFPTPWSRSAGPPPRDAIVLEAPQGAVAELDGPITLARGEMGRLENARLTGPVVIRSDMKDEGPGDDLEIKTRDVLLNDRGIWSDGDVSLRLGPHTGGGQKLDIRFLPNKQESRNEKFSIGGVHSIQLLRDVWLVFQQDGPALPISNRASAGEIELTCNGPLYVNVPDQTAEFEHDVQVFRHGDGPSDSLSCESLKAVFAERHGTFEPVLFEANGRPVLINSPLREIRGRCHRLVYDLRRAHLTLEAFTQDGTAAGATRRLHELCRLEHGPHELFAPRLEYTLNDMDPRQKLGTLHAAGPGRFTSAARRHEQSERVDEFTATWQDSVQLIRQGDVPVLSLFGRPELRMPGVVRLAAADLHLWLQEKRSVAGPTDSDRAQPGDGRGPEIEIVPDRLLARQSVELDSPQVTARVNQLEAWLVSPAAALVDDGQADASPPRHGRSRTLFSSNPKNSKSYYVEAEHLQIRAMLSEAAELGSAELTHLTLDGSVLFEQRTDPTQSRAPVWVKSDWLDVTEAHTSATTVHAKGRPVVAHVEGTTLRGGEITFDRANGRFDVPTPGEIAFALDRDLQGRPLDTPLPLNISWQGTLTFDGRQAVIVNNVHVRTPQEQLQTQRLTASLATPVALDTMQWEGQLQFEKLDCTGGVVLDRQTLDAGGLAAQEHAEVPDLSIERRLGRIHASGPGWLRSVQFERTRSRRSASNQHGSRTAFGALAPHHAGRPPAATPTSFSSSQAHGTSGLTYLRVDFEREMRGNYERREITFDGQVHCVRGPVTSWDESLHVEQLSQLPEDTVVLDAATLRINQWKRNGIQWYGMEAQGGVEVEGGLRGGSIFSARGSRLTYDQSKDLMILDGGAGWANLVLEESLGGSRQSWPARFIRFWPSQRAVEFDDVRNVVGELAP